MPEASATMAESGGLVVSNGIGRFRLDDWRHEINLEGRWNPNFPALVVSRHRGDDASMSHSARTSRYRNRECRQALPAAREDSK